MGADLVVEHRAFPLRPVPAENVPFKGTYREAGWRRCNQMSEGDGIVFNPWPHDALPGWSLPALEAAKVVAKQGEELFEHVHMALYEAFFTRSLNMRWCCHEDSTQDGVDIFLGSWVEWALGSAFLTVIPAQAGISGESATKYHEIPACAGMTILARSAPTARPAQSSFDAAA